MIHVHAQQRLGVRGERTEVALRRSPREAGRSCTVSRVLTGRREQGTDRHSVEQGSRLRDATVEPIMVLVVHPSLPVKSVKELIALAKAKNNELDYSSATTGSTSHLAAELFKSMTGTNIVRIPYSSGGTEITDLLSGRVQISFATAASIASHVKSGKLRGLAVTSMRRSALAPELPTVAASGAPGFEMITLYGLLAPAKVPAPVVNRMNREVARFITLPEQKEKLLAQGVEAVGSTPEQFAEAISSQMSKLGQLIKDLGLKAD